MVMSINVIKEDQMNGAEQNSWIQTVNYAMKRNEKIKLCDVKKKNIKECFFSL
jgi:hypothetical protein